MAIKKTYILLIDDSSSFLSYVAEYLEGKEYAVRTASSAGEGIRLFESQKPDLVITGLRLAGEDGMDVVKKAKNYSENLPVIIIPERGEMEDAVEALKSGAWDYIIKPLENEEILLHSVKKALSRKELKEENLKYQEEREATMEERSRKLTHTIEQLRKSEKKYYALVENMLSSLMILKDGVIVYANKTLLKTSGYELNELLGSKFIDHVHPNEQARILEYYHKRITAQESPESYRSRAIAKNGEVIYMDVKVENIHFGDEDAVMVVMNDVNEQVKILAKLDHSRQTLSTLFDNLPGMAYRCPNTPEWSMEFISKGVIQLTGYEPNEIIDDRVVSYGKLIHPDDRTFVWEKVQESIENNQAFEVEYRIIDKQGKKKWVWERGRCVNCKQGEEGILEGFISEITTRRKAENKLKDKETHYRTLFESASDAILMMEDYKYIDCNQATLEIFGYKHKKDILNKYPDEISPEYQPGGELSHTLAREYMNQALNGVPQDFDWRHLKKDGSEFDAQISLNAIEIEDRKYILSIVRDITERKQAEKKVRKSEKKFRDIFNHINDAIFIHNLQGDFIEVNEIACDRLGYTRNELLKLRPMDIDTPEHGQYVYDKIQKIEQEGELTFESIHRRKDGYTFPVEVNARFAEYEGKTAIISIVRDITERKKAEEKLRESEQKFRDIFNHTGDAIIILNMEGNLIEANDIARTRSGYTRDELMNKYITDLEFNENAQGIKERISILEQNGELTFETTIQRKYGTKVPVEINSQFIKYEGEPAIISVVRDITERKKAEEHLKYFSKLQGVLMNMSIRYINIPLQEVDKAINSALQEIGEFVKADRAYVFDYDFQKQITINTYEWCREGIEHQIDELQAVPLSELPYWVDTHVKGEPMYVSDVFALPHDGLRAILEPQNIKSLITVPMMHKGQCLGFVGFDSVKYHHTYTEREKILLEVFAQILVNIQMRALTENVKQLLYKVSQLSISKFNLKEYLGAIHEEISNIMKADNFYIALYDKNTDQYTLPYHVDKYDDLTTDEPVSLKNTLTDYIRKNGQAKLLTEETENELRKEEKIRLVGTPSPVWIGAPIYNSSTNEVTGVIALQDYEDKNAYNKDDLHTLSIIATNIGIFIERINNLENLKKAKEEAEESDRLKSAFLANMSHEIRTPMNGILGFANLLKESDLTEKDQREYIHNINKSGERMLNTINALIDISRLESGQMETKISETNINRQMDELYSFFQKNAGLRKLSLSYSKALSDAQAMIFTDPEKLYKTMVNLINNALKYTNEGMVEFGYRPPVDNWLEFYVRDTGIGIPLQHHKTIFDRFAQADLSITKPYEGSGLGLSITKAYVEMLGGEIQLESEPGEGSIFKFTIPYRQAEPAPDDKEKTENQNKSLNLLENSKVLIAEDEDASDIYLTAILKNQCREILHVTNGKEALQLVTEQPDIDLILMDLKMPEMDGYKSTREIRKINPHVKIIAQTAYALSGDRQKALDAGCDEYVSKPLTKSSLINAIEKLFNNS